MLDISKDACPFWFTFYFSILKENFFLYKNVNVWWVITNNNRHKPLCQETVRAVRIQGKCMYHRKQAATIYLQCFGRIPGTKLPLMQNIQKLDCRRVNVVHQTCLRTFGLHIFSWIPKEIFNSPISIIHHRKIFKNP